jgi:hypothetical protein
MQIRSVGIDLGRTTFHLDRPAHIERERKADTGERHVEKNWKLQINDAGVSEQPTTLATTLYRKQTILNAAAPLLLIE